MARAGQEGSKTEGSCSSQEGARGTLELTPEAQMRIIEQTGILERIPMRRPASGAAAAAAAAAQAPPPLVQFSTHELHAFAESLSQAAPPAEPKHPISHSTAPHHDHHPTSPSPQDPLDTLPIWVDRAFDTFLWSVPFTTVFVCLDVAIHAQYGQPMTVRSELGRVANVYPSAVFVVHYTLHYGEQLLAKLLLFGLSAVGGSYMVYIMNRLSYLLVMRRVPPLGALWIFAVVRMQLSHALFSLLLVALWAWVMDLSIYV
ncbi:hypothetical protein PCANC_26452 [Puccinia coronata f. sp. avenae]|uniref:DUF7719 domain-containing protein n=1 Tax=Puccinia coronata f. sp. avenae TaxID=200324 RepID=A0A2N5RZC4_9BASI|nr:hypothetical protein PCANC_26452 [Puccinia coronata f. sp. avenae]